MIINLLFIADNKINGAIFCHVIKIVHCNQFDSSITWGNQKWNGTIPIFINKAIISNVSILSICIKLLELKFIITHKSKINDARACDKKYLIEASVIFLFKLTSIRGIILIKLISKPNQAVKRELAEIVIMEPEIKVIKNIIWCILINMLKERGFDSYKRGMNPIA